MFAYCNNDPINYSDPSGEVAIVDDIFIVGVATILAIGTVKVATWAIDGIKKNIDKLPKRSVSSTPNAATSAVAGTVERIIPTTAINSDLRSKIDEAIRAQEKVKEDTIPNYKRTIVFPLNPYYFNPKGLIRKVRAGTDNGKIIQWCDGDITIFEWDEDIKNGAHYHVLNPSWKNKHLDGKHYYPFEPVPEPYASLYFY